MSYRLVTPNTEPSGFSDEYDTLDDPELHSHAAYLINRGHEYARVIEWPPRECAKWFNKYGKPRTVLDDWAEWVGWAWHEGLVNGHAYSAYKESGWSYEWLTSANRYIHQPQVTGGDDEMHTLRTASDRHDTDLRRVGILR